MSTLKVVNIQHPSAASATLILDSSGNLALPAGSASTPALQGPSDTNTGLFFPAADTIAFAEGGTEALRIDSSGRVGIGTSSPSYILEVRQDSSGVPVGINMVDTNASGRSYSIRSDAGQLRFRDVTGSADRVTLDSSGRLGIGTASPSEALTVGSGNAQITSGQLAVGVLGTSGLQFINNGTFGTVDSIPLVFRTVATERARLDTSGRLLVGTSTAPTVGDPQYGLLRTQGNTSSASGFGVFSIGRGQAPASITSGSELGHIYFTANDGSGYASISGYSDATSGTNDYPGRLVFSTTADGASSPTERGRFTSTGYFKASNNGSYTTFGTDMHELRTTASQWTTSIRNVHASDPYGLYITYSASPNNTTNPFVHCATDTGGTFAQIRSNGGLANVQANNVNLSDERTKKDISPASDTWNCIKEWEIVNYRYRNQPDDADLNLGVIAQQVAESCPEVITVFQEAKEATEDQPAQEERLGVKEQQMYWMAIKALQEAQVRIEQLEAKVAALESA